MDVGDGLWAHGGTMGHLVARENLIPDVLNELPEEGEAILSAQPTKQCFAAVMPNWSRWAFFHLHS